jgi:AP-4 complex subunit mu-1
MKSLIINEYIDNSFTQKLYDKLPNFIKLTEKFKEGDTVDQSILKKTNDVFVDVYEKINTIFDLTGEIIRSEIDGKVKMKSFLHGKCNISIKMNENLQVGYIKDDIG